MGEESIACTRSLDPTDFYRIIGPQAKYALLSKKNGQSALVDLPDHEIALLNFHEQDGRLSIWQFNSNEKRSN